MAFDASKTTYTATVNEDGSVTYTPDCDGVAQNLSGRDISSADALKADLDAYTAAYIAGKQLEQAQIGEGITVGQPIQGG